MDFTEIINNLTGTVLGLAHANPLIALAVLLIVAYLIYRKPVFFFSVFMLGLILAGVLYMIMSMSTSGMSQKEKLIHEGKEPENSLRLPGMML